ncbi:MAG: copper chaperone PCu(A)C [Sphingorhabdus sp.]
MFGHIKSNIAVAMSLAFLAACGPTPQLKVKDAVVKLSPVDSNPSALYFTVYGGPSDVQLINVNSPSVIRSQMHESGIDPKTGAMSMKPLSRVPIPAKSKVEFRQGGKHVMVWGVNLVARRLGEMETEFVFNNGDRILVKAPVTEMDGTVPDEKKALD